MKHYHRITKVMHTNLKQYINNKLECRNIKV